MIVRRKIFAALVASVSLCGTSVAAAVPAAPAAINPYSVIGVYGFQGSAQAVCGNAAAAAAVGAAATAQAPTPGCVLPVVDPAAVPAPVEPAPAAAVVTPAGFSLTPLLLGLIGIAGIAALIASQNGNDRDVPTPVSPA